MYLRVTLGTVYILKMSSLQSVDMGCLFTYLCLCQLPSCYHDAKCVTCGGLMTVQPPQQNRISAAASPRTAPVLRREPPGTGHSILHRALPLPLTAVGNHVWKVHFASPLKPFHHGVFRTHRNRGFKGAPRPSALTFWPTASLSSCQGNWGSLSPTLGPEPSRALGS